MNVIEWLKKGDPVIARLTDKYLLEQDVTTNQDGYIQKYLNLYDRNKKTWGKGIYSPKWISTHYTLLELKYMEINPYSLIFNEALKNLVDHLWFNQGLVYKNRYQDMCIVGMMVQMVCYAKIHEGKNPEMIDYILDHQFDDGGWNCRWDSGDDPKISSVHTTISVLEGLHEFIFNNYTYKIDQVKEAMVKGIECLLSRNIFLNKKTHEVLHKSMVEYHYPARWKYDYLRVLELLATIKYPYDPRMKKAMDLLIAEMKSGRLNRGQQISGLVHLQLEETRQGRFNTLRALKVLKFYQPVLYQNLIAKEI